MNFLLGVSFTTNVFLILVLYIIFKYRKVVSLYEEYREERKEIETDDEIRKNWSKFFSSDN